MSQEAHEGNGKRGRHSRSLEPSVVSRDVIARWGGLLQDLWWPAQRAVWRSRRRWLGVRAKALAYVSGASIELNLAPQIKLGRRVTIDIQPGTYNLLEIAEDASIGEDAVLQFLGGRMSFGRRTIVRRGFRADTSGTLVIGDDVFIGYGTFLHCKTSTVLKDKAVLAEYVVVTDSAHIRTPDDVPTFHHVRAAPTVVGANAWIGAHAVVTAGVSVGDGAFVGAHAVVTSDVDPGWLVAGNPARSIRRLDVETVEDG